MDSKTEAEAYKSILKIMFIFGSLPLFAMFNGYIFWLGWGWYMVPLGLPPLKVASCIGIGLMI